MKKIACGMSALIFLVSLSFNPAQASNVRNGMKCTKPNAKSVVSKKSYICGKNPIVMPKQFTWTRVDCLDDYAVLIEAKEEYENWKDTLSAGGPEGEKTLRDMSNLIIQLEKSIKSKTCKRGS